MRSPDPAATIEGFGIYDDYEPMVDRLTLEIVERRRRTAIVKRRGWLVRRMLLGADTLGLLVALGIADLAYEGSLGAVSGRAEPLLFVLTLPGWIVGAKLYGLYDRDEERTDPSTTDDLVGVFHLVTVCTWLFLGVCFITGLPHPVFPKVAIFWAAAIILVSASRAIARAAARKNVRYLQNTVIVGAGDVGQMIAAKFLEHPEYGINVVGFVDQRPKARREGLEHVKVLCPPEELPTFVRLFDIERVIVAFSNEPHERMLELVRVLKKLDIQIDIVPRFFEYLGPNVGFHSVEGIQLVGLPPLKMLWSSMLVKRLVDLVGAMLGLLITAPLLIVAALAVRLDSRGPVFYRHTRVGRGGRTIDVLKFRTMKPEHCRGDRYGGDGAEAKFAALMTDPEVAREFARTYKLTSDPRLTRVGRFLRRTSIDELPQLLNVLRGTLSLVGPRAITADELARYGGAAEVLLSVRPGITGYWQVNGRSRLSYQDRVRLDMSYLSGWSLALDLQILAKTARVLASQRGAQ